MILSIKLLAHCGSEISSASLLKQVIFLYIRSKQLKKTKRKNG